MIRGDDRAVNEVIVMCSFGLAFGTIGSYVFGAVWDDKNYMSAVKPKGDVEPDQWEGDKVDPSTYQTSD